MLIYNAKVVTWGEPCEILEDHAVWIEQGIIRELGPSAVLTEKHVDGEKLDAGGKLLMPGNICAHTHFYGAFARGMAIPGRPPRDFPEILKKLWWPLDKALGLEDVRSSALVCLVDAIKHGTTTLIDHHASPNAISGSLDTIAEAVEEAGLRSVLCYEVTDRDGPERAQAGIQENVRFIERCHAGQVAGGRVQGTFGLHASLTLSDRTLRDCLRAVPDGTGFHIHVAEHEADQYDSLYKANARVVDRLHEHGILGERTIVAHAIHVDAREIELLAQTGTWVSHQPRSNMNNGVGVADIESLLRSEVNVCLGNDGFSNAMWEEWKTAYLLHKVWHRDPRRLPGDLLTRVAVYNNARLAGMFFPEAPIGKISAGAQADCILVDYHPTTPLTVGNLPWHILFGFQESMISTTMVAGRLLMHERRLLTLDEAEITQRSRELVPDVWERYKTFVPAD
ncbi:MAG: putative aminohydrolase SsnA [Anaerolineales bacterium]|nr:MAG: putative aminohydrolase SsnA [Anaerolineales bacterium]